MTNPTQEMEKPGASAGNGHAMQANNKKGSASPEMQTQAQPQTQPETGLANTKQELGTPQGVERTREGKVYTPLVDIFETKDAMVIVADLPGVDEGSVDVTLEKNVLTIHGHVDAPQPAGYNPFYAEYGMGDYQRSFTISNDINWEGISGTVRDGVLKLTLPKAGPAQTKKISIKTEG